jgi:hypothetical protein
MAKAGLRDHIATCYGVLITEKEFFALWNTIVHLGQRPDFVVFVGRGLAN